MTSSGFLSSGRACPHGSNSHVVQSALLERLRDPLPAPEWNVLAPNRAPLPESRRGMVLLSVQPKAITFALPNNARAGWCIPLGNTGLFCLFGFGGGPSLQPGESFDGHVLTKAM